jgi:UPF0755 protein
MTEQSPSQSTPKPRRRGRLLWGILGGIAALLVVALIGGGVAAWWMLYRPANPQPEGQPVTIVVKKGSTAASIADEAAAAGVVPSAMMFRLKARDADMSSKFKPGSYQLATGMPYEVVFEALAAGPKVEYTDVTIPEGFTAKQVAERIASKTGISEDELVRLVTKGASQFAAQHPYLERAYDGSLEGYLFPKTYRIKKGASAESVVEMMLDQFDKEIANVDMSFATSKNLNTTDVTIIASILEKESQLDDEFPLVSSVIYNRLHQKMRLELCSTVMYTMPDGTKVLKDSDTKVKTPFNTYEKSGLPAGPICNPGLRALDAAAHPKQTKYLYYVLTGKDGSQTFAATYADFLKAKEKYKKTFGLN